MLSSLTITTYTFAYQLKIAESKISECSGNNFSNMINCMWNVIITLTSVGYGDIYPNTFMGRIVAIVVSFWGVFIASFFVVTVSTTLLFDEYESISYRTIMRLYHKLLLKTRAVDVLSTAFNHRNT